MVLLRIIAFPFALIYGAVVGLRNYLYDSGLCSSNEFCTPTICVGNLNLGGSGKTPMVEFLVSELKEDFKVAVLSRGYKRKSKGYILANKESTVEQLGDEPFQIFQKFENTIVAVDADRANGIATLEKDVKPNLIILDDAFQHRKVRPSFSILLTAYGKLYYDDYFVPMGTLRDARKQAKRADIIVVTKCPTDLSESDQKRIIEKLRPRPHQKVLFSFLRYSEALKGGSDAVTIEHLKGKKITLVTGIAEPKLLVNHIEDKGLKFEHLRFGDHHSFTKGEIELLNAKELVLTTEKDYVRLTGKIEKMLYIEIKHEFLGKGRKELLSAIETIMKPNS